MIAAYALPAFNGIAVFSTCVDIGGNFAGGVAGIMNTCGQAGAFLLSLVFGPLAQATRNFTAPVLVVALILLTGSLFWLMVNPNRTVQMETWNAQTQNNDLCISGV